MTGRIIKALLPPGRWKGSEQFQVALQKLEATAIEVMKKIDSESTLDFELQNKFTKRMSSFLDVKSSEVTNYLTLQRGAHLSYIKDLDSSLQIEEASLFKALIKNIPVKETTVGDPIGFSHLPEIIVILEKVKPAYVKFEYYDPNNRRIL